MAPILITALEVGLPLGLTQFLSALGVPAPQASFASTQFTTTFITAIEPTFTLQLEMLVTHGVILTLSIIGLLLWGLTTVRTQNQRTVSMFIGTILFVLLEIIAIALSFGSVDVKSGFQAMVFLGIMVPCLFCMSCAARCLAIVSILSAGAKRVLQGASVGVLVIFVCVCLPIIYKFTDFDALVVPKALIYLTIFPAVVHFTFAIGVFASAISNHNRRMSTMNSEAPSTTKMIARISTTCGILTTLMWIGYLTLMIISADTPRVNTYTYLFVAMIPLIEFFNDNFILIARVFFPGWASLASTTSSMASKTGHAGTKTILDSRASGARGDHVQSGGDMLSQA